MTEPADRYKDTNELWASLPGAAITRIEADRAARKLCRKFGRAEGYPRQLRDVRPYATRKCWISADPRSLVKGWPRLVHDISHLIFDKRYPQLRPHHPLHAALEYEISAYVVHETDWLRGGLQPPVKAKPSTEQKRAEKLKRTHAAIDRWETKLRRAQNALRKLERRAIRLEREQREAKIENMPVQTLN